MTAAAQTGATGSDVEKGKLHPLPVVPPRVIGLDLSLASTGIAGYDWAERVGRSLKIDATHSMRWDRLAYIADQLRGYIIGAQLIALEAPAYGINTPGNHERAWLWWQTVGCCERHQIPYAVVNLATVKVYATGNGKASKEDVVQAVTKRRPDVEFRGNDEADALVLAAMGLRHLGYPVDDPLPQTHLRAMASVTWPEVTL